MKKRVFALISALIVLFAGSFSAFAETEPAVSAKAAVLIEATTGRVLFSKNESEKLPMASTTKIMTAMLALEQPEPDREFTVDPEAIRVEGSSMGLTEGDRVTLRTLACGMLLPSGNDAANAAAVRIDGSAERFAARMNARAKALGLSDTHFVTPSGLDAEGHYSTALDMAKLTREALKNPDFRAICSSKDLQVEFGRPPYKRWLRNSNRLLGSCPGVFGVKTGFTDLAGRCLVSAAERDGVTLICVTLNDPDDWRDAEKLFDYGFSRVTLREIPASLAGSVEAVVTGGEAPACPVEPYGAATTAAEPGELTARICLEPFYYAPIEAGDLLGTVEYLYEGETVAAQPLMAAKSVKRLPAPETGQNPFSGFIASLGRMFRAAGDFFHHFG